MSTASVTMMPPRLSREDFADLAQAVRLLEGDRFASRLTRLLGGQVRAIGRALPSSARKAIALATETALKAALRVAVRSLNATAQGKASNRWHMAAASAAGAVGGAFGMAATAVEILVSTTILLRSIADIAREQGEDLKTPEAALACLEVFALGGERPTEAGRESGYFAVRAGLAQSVSESARFLVETGRCERDRAGIGPPGFANCRAIRRGCYREGRGAGRARRGRGRWGCRKRRLRPSFPGHGARPFHCPAARTQARG